MDEKLLTRDLQASIENLLGRCREMHKPFLPVQRVSHPYSSQFVLQGLLGMLRQNEGPTDGSSEGVERSFLKALIRQGIERVPPESQTAEKCTRSWIFILLKCRNQCHPLMKCVILSVTSMVLVPLIFGSWRVSVDWTKHTCMNLS